MTKKVYVLTHGKYYDEWEIVGVFSSHSKAIENIMELTNNSFISDDPEQLFFKQNFLEDEEGHYLEPEYYEIEEYFLDIPMKILE